MAAIFENRKIEISDRGNKLKFPGDAIFTNLPTNCRNLSLNQSAELKVEDDQGFTYSLTIKNDNHVICFTDWKKFTKGKSIEVGDGISLYKEGDSGAPQYRIKVTKA